MKAFLRLRWAWIIYGAVLAGVLTYAAILRFRLPQTPIIDPDIWGYLEPAFSQLQGGPFKHSQGRNFLYPAFLWVVLKGSGDYRCISGVQHVLGLLTGVLLAAAWDVLCGLGTAGGRLWRWGARFGGLLLVADFLLSRSPLLFEHTIRPEAVFPVFLALSLLLNLGALRARHPVPSPRRERWCLGANLFVTVVLQALKPSFGFAIVAANLPLLFWLLRRTVPRRAKLVTASGALAAAGLLLWLPEQVLKQGDTVSQTFLPKVLLAIHAPAIHEQITADLRDGQTGPYDAAWLRDFDAGLGQTLDAARQPENLPWPMLGFNADYLIFTHPVVRGYFPHGDPSRVASFCFYYYRRAWWHRPGEMLAKIGRQLAAVYPWHVETALGRGLRIDFRRKHWAKGFFHQQLPAISQGHPPWPLSQDYQSAWKTCEAPKTYAELAREPASQTYLQQVSALRETGAQLSEPAWVFYLNDFTASTRLPALIIAVLAGAVLVWRVGAAAGPLIAGVGLVFATNFAMFLTVGVVHTLDGVRYIETQQLLTLSSAFAAALLAANAVCVVWATVARRWAGPDLTPRPPATLPLP